MRLTRLILASAALLYAQAQDDIETEVIQEQAHGEINEAEEVLIPKAPEDPLANMSLEEKVQHYIENYSFEMAMVMFIVLSIMYFVWGKKRNERLIYTWLQHMAPTFRQNFAHLGFDHKESALKLAQESYCDYQFYATGRQNVHFVNLKLELERRQCIFTSIVAQPMLKYQDIVKVDIPIQVQSKVLADGQVTDFTPLEILIIRRKQQKAALERITYLKNMVGLIRAKNYDVINGEFVIFGDGEEVVNSVVDSQTGQALAKFSDYINQIHITDQRGYLNFPLTLQAEFRISDEQDDLNASEKIMKLLLSIADKVANLKLSTAARQRAEKNRKEVNKEKAKAKQEEQDEANEAKKRIEAHKLAEKLKTMTPEQQMRFEEKLAKKDNVQKKKKFAKMVKV